MKTRDDYASNSSSSSFVVITYFDTMNVKAEIFKQFLKNKDNNIFFGLQDNGQMKFGCQKEKYDDILSKWNWLLIQAWYAKNGIGDGNCEYVNSKKIPKQDDTYFNQLKGYALSIDSNGEFPDDDYFIKHLDTALAYIDHQSVGHWKDTGKAFHDLHMFLQPASYIQCGDYNF